MPFRPIVSTDPPYYDNIGYADLSDFFYVWLRRSLKPVFPDLFATLAVPKAEELVAAPYRHGGKEQAEAFFLDGMTQAMHRLAEQAHPAFPVTSIMPSSSRRATARGHRQHRLGDVSRRRDPRGLRDHRHLANAHRAGTRQLKNRNERSRLQHHPRLPPRAIGCAHRHAPRVSSPRLRPSCRWRSPTCSAATSPRWTWHRRPSAPAWRSTLATAKVLDAEGKPLSVREALALINQTLDEALAEQEGDFDADSRWALAWFEHRASPKASTAWPRRSPRPRTPASPVWSRPASLPRAAARCDYSSRTNCPPTGTRPRTCG